MNRVNPSQVSGSRESALGSENADRKEHVPAEDLAADVRRVLANINAHDIVLPGDIVTIDEPLEHRGSSGVVTQIYEKHCAATVLDGSRRFGVGESWPYLSSLEVETKILRIGSRVVLDGLQGINGQRMNGHRGTIVAHPREGHPNFITKPSCPNHPILTVCVRFDESTNGGFKSMLIEPRFLVAYESYVQRATDKLVNEAHGFTATLQN